MELVFPHSGHRVTSFPRSHCLFIAHVPVLGFSLASDVNNVTIDVVFVEPFDSDTGFCVLESRRAWMRFASVVTGRPADIPIVPPHWL